MSQGRDIDGVGPSGPKLWASRTIGRTAALFVLCIPAWTAWDRRGAVVGCSVAFGFAFPALRVLFQNSAFAWASRHRVQNRVGWCVCCGSFWLWIGIWQLRSAPVGDLLAYGVFWAAWMLTLNRWSDHKQARADRTLLLARLATDLQRVASHRPDSHSEPTAVSALADGSSGGERVRASVADGG